MQNDDVAQGTNAMCPHAAVCGGCSYQDTLYEEQLLLKNNTVLEHLAENGITPLEYRPVRATGVIFGYRNKMEYTFGDEVKGGPMTLGMHKQGSYMSVVNTDGCLIVPESFNRVRSSVYEWAVASGHMFHHKRTHSGFLRSLVIRRGERTGELLVNLVTTSEETLDEEAFCEAVIGNPMDVTQNHADAIQSRVAAMQSRVAAMQNPFPAEKLVGIIHTINDRRSDVVACDSMKTLYGRDHFFEELMGFSFCVEAFSFVQTNTSAVESMLHEALSFIPDISGKTLYDVYCGTGAISLALSKHAERVIGIELNEDSVVSARENAKHNGIENAAFICGDAAEELNKLPAPDLLVLDPPRMGLHPKALKRVIEYNAPAILYISCNPKTFAQNAAVLKNAGYRISILGAYDNFPFTRHIELAALLEIR